MRYHSETYEQLTERGCSVNTADNGSSQTDSRARTFPLPGREQDFPESAPVFGLKCTGLSARYDRGSWLQRTSQPSLFEDSIPFSGRWPKSGMMRNGHVFELQTWERRTEESVSGLWPTPTANNHTGAGMRGTGGPNLQTAILWPTPTVHGNNNLKGMSANSGDGLFTAVKNWPTPCARGDTRETPESWQRRRDVARQKNKKLHDLHKPLSVAVKLYPTPTANDAKNATLPPSQCDRDSVPGALMRDGVTGSLNADWVEWLMGYPQGWTDIDVEPEAFAGWGNDPADIGVTPRTISGQKNRAARLRCLGNAVVPQIPELIYRLWDDIVRAA